MTNLIASIDNTFKSDRDRLRNVRLIVKPQSFAVTIDVGVDYRLSNKGYEIRKFVNQVSKDKVLAYQVFTSLFNTIAVRHKGGANVKRTIMQFMSLLISNKIPDAVERSIFEEHKSLHQLNLPAYQQYQLNQLNSNQNAICQIGDAGAGYVTYYYLTTKPPVSTQPTAVTIQDITTSYHELSDLGFFDFDIKNFYHFYIEKKGGTIIVTAKPKKDTIFMFLNQLKMFLI